jgi:hypothetical protein
MYTISVSLKFTVTKAMHQILTIKSSSNCSGSTLNWHTRLPACQMSIADDFSIKICTLTVSVHVFSKLGECVYVQAMDNIC